MTSHKIVGVQLLRFIAALVVVITHIGFYISERLSADHIYWAAGARGVDLFFVISGYVMLMTSDKLVSARDGWIIFLKNRIIRIVPMYWGVTLIKVFLTLTIPGAAIHNIVSADSIFYSLLFIPYLNRDGHYEPIMGVGWTLNFEALFYLAVAVSLALRINRIYFIFIIFSIISCLDYINYKIPNISDFYIDSILMEFVYGMIIYKISKKLSAGLALSYALLAIGLIMLFIAPSGDYNYYGTTIPRAVVNGIPACIAVYGGLRLAENFNSLVKEFCTTLGDSSYSLYLIHPILAPGILVIFSKLGYTSISGAYLICLCACIFLSILVHKKIEIPVCNYFRNVFRG